jgi:hypothetical protein
MIGTYQKQPWEQETLKIDWSSRIASIPISGFAITSVAVSVFDEDGTDMTDTMVQGDTTYDGENNIYPTFSGGEDGKKYDARIRVILSKAGETDQKQEEDLRIKVKEQK